jgi:hypothetical protein
MKPVMISEWPHEEENEDAQNAIDFDNELSANIPHDGTRG